MERTEELDPVEDVSEGEMEARAERIASLERDIRDASAEVEHDGADVEHEVSFSRPLFPGSRDVRRADVVDIEQRTEECWLTVDVNGDEFDYRLENVVDPTDTSSSLVRLCKWRDIDPENIADLREVPVVRYGDQWQLFLPPERRTTRTRVSLPTGQVFSFTHPTLVDYLPRAAARFVLGMLKTPLVFTNARHHEKSPFDGLPLWFLLSGATFAGAGTALSDSVGSLLAVLYFLLVTASAAGIVVGDSVVGNRLRTPSEK